MMVEGSLQLNHDSLKSDLVGVCGGRGEGGSHVLNNLTPAQRSHSRHTVTMKSKG